MDLSRVKDEEKLRLCRIYFYGESPASSSNHPPVGLGLLPLLWAVNAVWFFRDAFLRQAFAEQKRIRTCEFEIEESGRLFASKS